MKIIRVSEHTVYRVRTDEDQFPDYTRWGPDSWMQEMGESEEQFYDCGEMEAMFQAFQATQKPLKKS